MSAARQGPSELGLSCHPTRTKVYGSGSHSLLPHPVDPNNHGLQFSDPRSNPSWLDSGILVAISCVDSCLLGSTWHLQSFDAPLHTLTVFDWWHPPTKDISISRIVNGRPFANGGTWHGTVSRRDDQLYMPYLVLRTFKTPFPRVLSGVEGARVHTMRGSLQRCAHCVEELPGNMWFNDCY